MSPRASVDDIFKDNGAQAYSVFGRHQNQIPYFITSPPYDQPTSTGQLDDVSDDDDDDDVISLSTIPEVPSVMAGTLSPSEFMELGSSARVGGRRPPRTADRDRRPALGSTSRLADDEATRNSAAAEVGVAPFYENYEHVSSNEKQLSARRRRLTVLLTSVVIVFMVVLAAIVVVVVFFLGQTF